MRTIVIALVQAKDNKFLMGKRTDQNHTNGYWVFPGGSVEVGESIQEVAKREVMEEVGVDIFNEEVQIIDYESFGLSTKSRQLGLTKPDLKFKLVRISLGLDSDLYSLSDTTELDSVSWIDQDKLSNLNVLEEIGNIIKTQLQ